MGGSVVWVLFPPIVRSTPLPSGQPEEMLRAIAAFRAAGQEATSVNGLDTFDV